MNPVFILCAATALAVPPVASARLTASHPHPLDVESAKTFVINEAGSLFKPVRTPQRAGSGKKLTRNQLLGTYIFDELSYSNAHVGWQYMFAIPEIVAGDNPDEVIISGFWNDYDTSYDPPVPISRVPAKFDYEAQTLTVAPGASLGTYGNYSAYMYVTDCATNELLDEPIVFNVDPDTRCISYLCERVDGDWGKPLKCLIITSYPDAVGQVISKGVDFLGAVVMNKYNGVMSITNVTSGQSGYIPVYTEIYGEDFTVYNFGGYGFDSGLSFTTDLEAGTATAPRTLWGEDAFIDENTTADIFYAGLDGGEIKGTLDAPAAGTNVRRLTVPSWCFLDARTEKPLVEFSDALMDVDFDLAVGVDSVVAEPAGDVEYYTLDGMRVDCPAKGTVVICRRGGKATKMIIR